MELGQLKNAIRHHKGTVLLEVTLAGHHVAVPIQKAGFMDALKGFGDQRNHETGLAFYDGVITVGSVPPPSTTLQPEQDYDLFDDLFQ